MCLCLEVVVWHSNRLLPRIHSRISFWKNYTLNSTQTKFNKAITTSKYPHPILKRLTNLHRGKRQLVPNVINQILKVHEDALCSLKSHEPKAQPKRANGSLNHQIEKVKVKERNATRRTIVEKDGNAAIDFERQDVEQVSLQGVYDNLLERLTSVETVNEGAFDERFLELECIQGFDCGVDF